MLRSQVRETEVVIYGIAFQVKYKVIGEYSPPSWYEPAEYPWLVVLSLSYEDKEELEETQDFYEKDTESKVFQQLLYKKLWQDYNDWCKEEDLFAKLAVFESQQEKDGYDLQRSF